MGVSVCHPRGLATILSEVYSTTSGHDHPEAEVQEEKGQNQDDIEAAYSSTQSMGATTEGDMGGKGRQGHESTTRIAKRKMERATVEGHERSSCPWSCDSRLRLFIFLVVIGVIIGIVVWKMG